MRSLLLGAFLPAALAVGCSESAAAPPADGTFDDAGTPAVGTDAASANQGADAGTDAGPAYAVDTSCEGRYWRSWIGKSNAGYSDLDALAYTSLARIRAGVDALNAKGAKITLGGTLALLLYEGEAKVAFVNDACRENSYVKTTKCWETPQARLSYQLGLGAVHTSIFYPCRDVNYTSKMRARFHDAIASAGYAVTPAQLQSVAADLATVCPSRSPEPIDYYVFAIHRDFGVPTDTKTNDTARVGTYPFFDPKVSIELFLAELGTNAAALVDDRAMIAKFGGSDGRYAQTAFQDQILKSWQTWQAAECP